MYVKIIPDIYDKAGKSTIRVRGEKEDFTIKIGIHQRSAFSPHLFLLLMDEFMKGVQDKASWCMLFTDDMVLIDKKTNVLEDRHERW